MKSGSCASVPGVQTLTIPTIDTTKLAGQLSVVQELPEVSKLVFQEVKQEEGGQGDSIDNILENMKQEQEPSSLSPLDYTVSSTSDPAPLNLVNNLAKGIKRVTAPVQNIPHDSKRIKNVYVVQGEGGQQILQELPPGYLASSYSRVGTEAGHAISSSVLCIDPPSPSISHEIKKEPKSKSASPKLNLTKAVNGTTLPSSKTCNWVFENGQVCGKTFSKSYNLVVHMRMHEDIRPFACTLCDQTFRQKAHLQRHETTHGIQTKNFYRTPAAKKKKKKPVQKLSKGLQDRLSKINQNLNKNGELAEDSEGEDYMEEEEEELYSVPGGKRSTANIISRKYSEQDKDGGEMETEEQHQQYHGVKQELQGDLNMNIITQHGEDDDTSTVQDILQTVNSVPTLEQKLEQQQFLCSDNLLLRALPASRPIMSSQTAPSYPAGSGGASLPHITKLVESTSISHLGSHSQLPLPADLSTTSSQTLPGGTSLAYSLFHSSPAAAQPNTTAQTNILFTTLSAPTSSTSASNKSQLSFIETSVPAGAAGPGGGGQQRQLVLDGVGMEEHSPEIQAEILNALLADQSYVESAGQEEVQELWEEEIYRLASLPAAWWVSRRRKHGLDQVTYYSPQGYSFTSRDEIQEFLATAALPDRQTELRSPPLPIDQIPVIEDGATFPALNSPPPAPSNSLDTNSIAQALIANLKPEPIESLKEALGTETKLRDSLSSPAVSCATNVLALSPVS